MADASGQNNSESNEFIEQYVSITGADKEAAKHILEAFNWDLESAVNMYLEGSIATSSGNNKKSSINDDEEISEIMSAGPSSSSIAANQRKKRRRTAEDDAIVVEDTPKSSGACANPSNQNESIDVDDYVRAPIPQKQAVLVEDQYHALPYPQRRQQATVRNVFDGFRDFRKETEEHERLLKSGKGVTAANRKMKRLHELFRPPVDMLYPGDFQSARNVATKGNKWLLVNLQNTMEFACQVLNRDVWANNIVREIIKENFIFWQVYHDSDEGQHYRTFYKVSNYPHLAVIDPRTGERMVIWENLGMKPTANQFAELATLFLSENPSLNGENAEDEVDMKVTTDVDSASIIDRSEDAQLEAAIKASLEMKTLTSGNAVSNKDDATSIELDDDSNSVEEIEGEQNENDSQRTPAKRIKLRDDVKTREVTKIVLDEKPAAKSPTKSGKTSSCPMTTATRGESSTCRENTSSAQNEGEKAKILLRTPSNERKQIVVSLGYTLEDLAKEISSLGWCSTRYDLVKSFPRQNLSSMDQQLTLKEIGFHKQETLFIQDR